MSESGAFVTPPAEVRFEVVITCRITNVAKDGAAVVEGVGKGHTPQDAYQEAFRKARAAFLAMAAAGDQQNGAVS